MSQESWKYEDEMLNRRVRVHTGKNQYRDGVLQCYDPESKSIILAVDGDNGSAKTVFMIIGSAIQTVQILEDTADTVQ